MGKVLLLLLLLLLLLVVVAVTVVAAVMMMIATQCACVVSSVTLDISQETVRLLLEVRITQRDGRQCCAACRCKLWLGVKGGVYAQNNIAAANAAALA